MTLSELLKSDSTDAHDTVDHAVMSMKPFESAENYHKFLKLQAQFHRVVKPAYHLPHLQAHFGDLAALDRTDKIQKDMADLKVSAHDFGQPPAITDDEYIGWLYCAEGSNVGAAILYKHAGKISLDENFGASHLAAHSDGRMPHWRAFKAKLDSLPLDDAQIKAAQKGARDAFEYYQKLITDLA